MSVLEEGGGEGADVVVGGTGAWMSHWDVV
jgi:hypothetical protein